MKRMAAFGLIVLGSVMWYGEVRGDGETLPPTSSAPPVAEASAPAPAEPAPPPQPEWKGILRVLLHANGSPRAIRLIAADRLYAVETNELALSWAAKGDRREVQIRGQADIRDGRTWLVPSSISFPDEEPAAPAETAPAPLSSTPTNVPPPQATTP
jgi:hypothetical protein